MQYRRPGNADFDISVIGLGTMTWGEQNTEAEAHQQLDYALSRGVNFIDTAEMYPVPPLPDTQGDTERFIGSWLTRSGKRNQVILASKAAGPVGGNRPGHIRNGKPHFDRANLSQALDDSLRRLQTDYLDLYQLHWPDRPVNSFGQLGYQWAPLDEQAASIEETLQVLADFVQAGKIRSIGVSNETPWGVAQFLRIADKLNLPRIVSIQNPYSLLNRTYEIGLSEFSRYENIGLLAYSPLAFGVLSGKYLNGARPEKARLTLFDRFTRYTKAPIEVAAKAYVDLANEVGISPVHLALAFVNSRPFVTSNLIGATSLEQLKENIDSIDVVLSDDVLAAIEAIHLSNANPAP